MVSNEIVMNLNYLITLLHFKFNSLKSLIFLSVQWLDHLTNIIFTSAQLNGNLCNYMTLVSQNGVLAVIFSICIILMSISKSGLKSFLV